MGAAGGGRLAAGDVAAWLLKTSRPPAELAPGWRPGQERRLERCVRRSYRLGLMAPGQPCVLWLSGRSEPGVHAVGRLVDDDGPPDSRPAVEVALTLLADPVPRSTLVRHTAFADAEVVRMAAGSNPSYLTARQLAALVELLELLGNPPPPHIGRVLRLHEPFGQQCATDVRSGGVGRRPARRPAAATVPR